MTDQVHFDVTIVNDVLEDAIAKTRDIISNFLAE